MFQIGSAAEDKPAIWIDAGIHAREWIAPATALYVISQVGTARKWGKVTPESMEGQLDTLYSMLLC